MELNINGVVVSMENTGSVSKGGKEILQANGVTLQDGTKLYIKAYRGEDKKKEVSEKVKPTIRSQRAAVATAGEVKTPDLAAMIAEAVAKAMASLQTPTVAVVKPSSK